MDIRCICPPKADGTPRHDHDTITLRERMDFRSSIAIRNALALDTAEGGELDMADVLAMLTERFIRYGIESWTIVDDKGKAIPVSQASIASLIISDIDLATDIGDVADDLYREAVLLPLVGRGSKSSPVTPTSGSTPAKTPRSTRRRKPSSPSSTSTTRTGGIATISVLHDGDSSSSPSSESAAS